MATRQIQQVIPAQQTSDGAGVQIKRSLGQTQAVRLDPFLMLDEFGAREVSGYMAGFPSHPHRGFETVTYMIEGHMLHEDHLGNQGHLKNGGVQWMTAGRGIIHSEMPQQEGGAMRGFQLWLNLPAAEKMKDAGYRDIQPEDIPTVEMDGARIKLIAGKLTLAGESHSGAVTGASTQPLYLDIHLDQAQTVTLPVPDGHSALLYLYEGAAEVEGKALTTDAANVLSDGETVTISGTGTGTRILLIAGRPINEPIVQYGPFVMNTRAEIEQAMRDYQSGALTA